MSSERSRRVYVFFSYARQDKVLRDKLEDHLANLKYRGLISTWHDREISAGTEWAQQIDVHLDSADIILLLISASFMASNYCYSIEMRRAMGRHERREARVIPILLRPVLFTDAPFAKLQFLPTNGRPVVNWRNRDSAFVDIALGIERVVQEHFISLPLFELGERLRDLYPSPHLLHQRRRPPPMLYQRQRRLGTLFLSLVTLSLIIVLSILLAQHPNVILLVGAIFVGLIFLVGVIVTIRAWREREQAERRQREQERAYYEKALMAYDRALRGNSSDATAYRGKGNALAGLGRYDEALQAFEQAIALTPQSATYLSKPRHGGFTYPGSEDDRCPIHQDGGKIFFCSEQTNVAHPTLARAAVDRYFPASPRDSLFDAHDERTTTPPDLRLVSAFLDSLSEDVFLPLWW